MLATLTLGVAVALGASGTAESRHPQGCTIKGAKTLRATKHARVIEKGTRVYGCLYRTGRRFLLANPAYGVGQVRNVRLAGRVVGYSRQSQGKRKVTVRELRRGRIVHDAAAAVAPRCCSTAVTDLELRRNGSVAWIAETIPFDIPLAPPGSYPDPRPDYQVRKADRAGQALLDAAHDVAPRSLMLSGATISWTRGGTTYAAVLD